MSAMTDRKEIEGSPERAADRGRQEDLGFPAGDVPSLGSPSVVRGLVSQFAVEVVEVRKRYNAGRLSGDDAQEHIRDLAVEYGNIVMGRDSRYAPLPWNDPARLGRRIKLVVPPTDGVEDPGELLFLTVGLSLVELAASHEEGRTDDAQAKQAAGTMLDDTAQLILGVR